MRRSASAACCCVDRSRAIFANPRLSPSRSAVPLHVEPGAVLAHVKPLVGGAALFVSPPQFARRHAGSAVLGGEQHLHVLADGFVGAVPEHPLRPGIPRVDDALAAHREDGVLERAVDEQPQALLAAAQQVLGLTALADVLERDDHAVDAIVRRPVWPQPGQDPAPVAGVTLTVDGAQIVDHALQSSKRSV